MTDVYDERAARGKRARPEAQKAAAQIARTVPLEGHVDPAYVAHVIQAKLDRFEKDPDAPIMEKSGSGKDPMTGMTWDELLEGTQFKPTAGTDPILVKVARAAAIRIAQAYVGSIQPESTDFLEWAPGVIVEHLTQETWQPRVAQVEESLRQIQAHRRTLGMGPLDTAAAGWTEEDVFDEAQRIARLPNPLEDLKHRLI